MCFDKFTSLMSPNGMDFDNPLTLECEKPTLHSTVKVKACIYFYLSKLLVKLGEHSRRTQTMKDRDW